MEYILFSFLALVASSGNIIFNRLGANRASAVTNSLLKSFYILIACFLICAVLGHVPTLYSLTGEQWIWIVLVGLFLSVDWIFYFLAIKRSHLEAFAPFVTAGTLFLSNTLFSIFTFSVVTNGGKALNVIFYFIGLALLLISLIYIVFNKKINPKGKALWILFAFISVLSFAFVLLIAKLKLSAIPADIISFHQTSILFFVMVLTAIFTKSVKNITQIYWKAHLYIFVGAVFNALMVVTRYAAFSYSNSVPAIVNCIVGLDFIIVSVGTVLFFKAKNKPQILILVLLVASGMILNTLAGLI